MLTRIELKRKSKDQLRGNWGKAIVATLIVTLITSLGVTVSRFFEDGSGITITTDLIAIFFGGVFTVGLSKFLLNFTDGADKANISDILSGFSIYFKTLGLYLLYGLIVCIGCILLVVPGIIFSLMFYQAFFILAEDNEKGIIQCLKESANLMKENKLDFFVLQLSFIGWIIISILTLGIGYIWLQPYMSLTEANYYLELKNK
ncbi:DUF975 family protein [Clostridium sp.]|uniref:DUF975 family protein n=1 Tax=Clostridium sp. TaxID=1506 RepID=UPI003F3F6FC0